MTIYLDVVFIENIIMNYIILYGTAVIAKIIPKHIRLIIASGIGAVYAIVTYISVLKVYSNIVLKIILSIIIVYIAFNPQTVKKMLKQLLLFYLTSFVFGGAAFFLIYVVKPQDIVMRNGVYVGTYPFKVALLGAILGFLVISTSFKTIKTKLSKKSLLCNIKINLNQKVIKTVAMIDTGNLLKDPLSNSPVVVVEHSLLYDILPNQILNNLENILGGELEKISKDVKEQYMSKLKVIPFSSLGKQNRNVARYKSR
ncbi:MAG: sigma-E processing peptidase SpoIIGA [Clostridia bacterium]|nr:sigma-E processing peptidase SpoIIGA [Clostridia bacterium]